MQVVERHRFTSPACAPVERHVLERSWKLWGAISAIMERGASCKCSEGAAAPSARTWNWSWITRQSLLECSAQALVHAGIRFDWEGMRPAGGEGGRKSNRREVKEDASQRWSSQNSSRTEQKTLTAAGHTL